MRLKLLLVHYLMVYCTSIVISDITLSFDVYMSFIYSSYLFVGISSLLYNFLVEVCQRLILVSLCELLQSSMLTTKLYIVYLSIIPMFLARLLISVVQ